MFHCVHNFALSSFSTLLKPLNLFTTSVLVTTSNLATTGRGLFEMQKYPEMRNFFEKNCFNLDSNLGPLTLRNIDLTLIYYFKQTSIEGLWWICHLSLDHTLLLSKWNCDAHCARTLRCYLADARASVLLYCLHNFALSITVI